MSVQQLYAGTLAKLRESIRTDTELLASRVQDDLSQLRLIQGRIQGKFESMAALEDAHKELYS